MTSLFGGNGREASSAIQKATLVAVQLDMRRDLVAVARDVRDLDRKSLLWSASRSSTCGLATAPSIETVQGSARRVFVLCAGRSSQFQTRNLLGEADGTKHCE